jgi:hypothetical protein
LEAPHVLRVDVGHAMVSLVVLGLSDGGPFLGFGDAVDNDSGEAVCGVVSRVQGLSMSNSFWDRGLAQGCIYVQ